MEILAENLSDVGVKMTQVQTGAGLLDLISVYDQKKKNRLYLQS